ncbi:hybrid sensor histidine kinase/response regulator [Magnetococcus sp. PR-3]|uniref:hybrid sensor histidine kinase/response regulator n=1 Tax=Magnetococcus sp. PR-3 TaxID=3120355 RepID=UPI002FCE492E
MVSKEHLPFQHKTNPDGDDETWVYLADNDEAVVRDIEKLLTIYGLQVQCFQSCQVLKEAVEVRQPHLLVMDLAFEQGCGEKLLEALLQQCAPPLPVIFLSQDNSIEQRMQAHELGGASFLSKPLDHAHLLWSVESHLGSGSDTPIQLMVVDDDEDFVRYLSHLLSKEQMQVRGFYDGESALASLSEWTPDLVILDQNLPQLSGMELLSILRMDAANLDLPILFVSGEEDPVQHQAMLRTGAEDFFVKPIHAPTFAQFVRSRVLRFRKLKRSRQFLEKAQNRLGQFSTFLTRVMGMAAHDLRNPLNAIMGMSMMLTDGELTEQERGRFSESIHVSSNRMFMLLDSLMDMAMLWDGRLQVQRSPGDLLSLLRERVEIYRWSADEREVALVMDCKPLPALAYDAARMCQVIDNLLNHALKFSPRHGEVKVACYADNDGVQLLVEDQGPHLDETELGELLDGVTLRLSRNHGRGRGLGLAIAKEVVVLHKGQMRLENVQPMGMRTVIHLPLSG